MIDGAKLKPALETVGFYMSGAGGAIAPSIIPSGVLFFELITEGAVYRPSGDDLHRAGAVFAHSSGQPTVSKTPGEGRYACMTVAFRRDRLDQDFDWPRVFQWEDVGAALRFSEEILYAFHHTDLDHSVLGDVIWSQFRFRLEEFRRKMRHQAIPPVIVGVMNHLDHHYAEPVGMEALAAEFGLSASHLHALFREHVGMTPHQHLILQRMRFARHKLVTTRDPIKSIARDAGYANTESFCRVFKHHSGLTAAAYRRKFMP